MGWIKSHWKALLAGVAAFCVGAAAGASGANQQEKIDRQDSQIKSLRDDLRAASLQIESRGETIQQLGSYREDALKFRAHRDRIAREQTAAREAARQRRAEARERERQAREAAERAAQGTIDGDGTWHVGEDFAAGTYRADAGEGCYWARLQSAHGGDSLDNIVENGLGGGAQTVTLAEGEWFETADCGQWQKIG
jgi:hypothetical protein